MRRPTAWDEYPDQCPKCHAQPGRPCLSKRGIPTDPHPGRPRVATSERKLRHRRQKGTS